MDTGLVVAKLHNPPRLIIPIQSFNYTISLLQTYSGFRCLSHEYTSLVLETCHLTLTSLCFPVLPRKNSPFHSYFTSLYIPILLLWNTFFHVFYDFTFRVCHKFYAEICHALFILFLVLSHLEHKYTIFQEFKLRVEIILGFVCLSVCFSSCVGFILLIS